MYQLPYAEILDDDGEGGRQLEREAFDRVIARLELGDAAGTNSPCAVEAMYLTRQLWMILMTDLGSPDNGLPESLRARLISIGIWVLKECDRVRRSEIDNLRGLIEINSIVRNGLR